MGSIADNAAQLGTLAEPSRAALYAYVVGQPNPVGREQAAEALDIPVHSAKFHLDKLVEAGLLEVEYRRLGERTGRGAGRPSKLYRRSAQEVQVSVPPRRYDLVGAILAAAVEQTRHGRPIDEALHAAAHDYGRTEAERVLAMPSADAPGALPRLARILEALGYEPQQAECEHADCDDCADRAESTEDLLVLRNCPFDRLAGQYTELVCELNLDFVDGVIDGAGCAGLSAWLEPSPDTCCVRAGEQRREREDQPEV